ncbi:MAG TPA: F0F1 ATP synthase subunit A, partial [Ignavibacteriaceae bacterium]|nr:F0F1 ATP synthase subunit A [Ignavibacteriaceae bacterium]
MIDSTTAIISVDSIKTAQSNSSSDWILHHVMDGNYLDFSPMGKLYLPHLQLFGLDISITKHVVFMWLGAILLFFVMTRIAKAYKTSIVPKGFTNFWEVFILFVRDEIARPTIGKGFEKFLPYLLTVFFFILFGNFLGLVPFSATFTSNISVTATMA